MKLRRKSAMFIGMYTTQTRRGYSSYFLKEPWRIKEKLAIEKNIPKTD
jgi:hypothetical protein